MLNFYNKTLCPRVLLFVILFFDESAQILVVLYFQSTAPFSCQIPEALNHYWQDSNHTPMQKTRA
jgi:hypothetical protein